MKAQGIVEYALILVLVVVVVIVILMLIGGSITLSGSNHVNSTIVCDNVHEIAFVTVSGSVMAYDVQAGHAVTSSINKSTRLPAERYAVVCTGEQRTVTAKSLCSDGMGFWGVEDGISLMTELEYNRECGED